MKTAFALAFLAASSEAAISAVTAAWTTTVHTADSVLQICATHGTAVTSGASNTISYQYVGATCTGNPLSPPSAAELTWGTGDDITAAGTTNAAAKPTCALDASTKTVTCNTIDVAQNKVSCVNIKKCRPTERAAGFAGFQVKQSQTDSTYQPAANAAAGAAWAPAALTTLTVTKPTTADAVVGAPEFDLTFAFESATDIAIGKRVTVLAPGYIQDVGGQCKFGSGTASTAITQARPDQFTFDVAGASGITATTLVCTKVKTYRTSAMAADKFVVMWGNEGNYIAGLQVNAAKWVASPAITSGGAPPGSGGDSASTVSLSAAALLLAASMYL
jgi:hypothetical protein